jgi:hypothetical protein
MFKPQNRAMTGVARFAHLLGIAASASADDERDDEDAAADDNDEDMAADDEDDADDKAKKSKKAKKAKAEDDEDDHDAQDDKGDEDAESEDDNKDAKSARAAECARWSKVMASEHAGNGRIAMACQMLSTTNLSAAQIIGTLASAPTGAAQAQADRRGSLYGAMAGRDPKPGGDGGKTPGASLADQIKAARAAADGK